ncbi:MAG: hypothetical protein ABH849_00955 [Nanoarchaeota archaeon]
MLDKLKEKLKEIKELDKFKDWNGKHFDAYLCSIFVADKLQFDFYDPETDRITSFNGEEVIEEQEILRKEKKKLIELKLDDLKIDLDNVKEIIKKLIDEKYKGESSNKEIVFLQNFEDKIIWNVTYITDTFNILNIKVDAKTGEILFEKIESALNWKVN